MAAQRRPRWRGRRKASGPDNGSHGNEPLGEALHALLKAMGGTPGRAGLQRLWDNWEGALGEELAALARPLGHHAGKGSGEAGAVLLLGAEDAMLLQELRFRGEEILARVNGFLGLEYFSHVQVSLPLGRSAPARSRAADTAETPERRPNAPASAATGCFLTYMDAASPVARCYARFVRQKAASADRGGRRQDKSVKDEE